MSTFNLDNILSQFLIEGKVESVKPLGNGLINDTFRVDVIIAECASQKYV